MACLGHWTETTLDVLIPAEDSGSPRTCQDPITSVENCASCKISVTLTDTLVTHTSQSSYFRQDTHYKQAFIDVRLRPSITMPLMAVAERCSLQPNVTPFIKLEVHNVSQCCQRKTEPRPQGICAQNFLKIGPAVPEICSWADRQTDGLITILCTSTRAE